MNNFISDIDKELLLEDNPENTLKCYPIPKIIDKIEIYAKIVNKIASTSMQNNNIFTHVEKWCQILNDIPSDIIEKKLITKALLLKDHLLATSQNEYICHGNLHLSNIIQNNNSWISINHQGVIAEKEFEVSAFDLLTDEEISKQVNLAKRIISRNHSLAVKFGFEPQRLLAWIFLRMLINAQQCIKEEEDFPNTHNEEISKNIFIAQQIFPLLK